MCWTVITPAPPERDYTEHMRQLIGTFGWAVQGVERDGIHPPWAYTVGLTVHRQPELVITGMSLTRATRVLNGVAAHVLHADAARAGHPGGAARRPARRGDQGGHALGAPERSRRVLRRAHAPCSWCTPTSAGTGPGTTGYQGVRGGQPVLGPREPVERRKRVG